MAKALSRIAWYSEELDNLGPIKIRTAQIALGSTPRLFDIILGVALRNRLVSRSGKAHISVRILDATSLAQARPSSSEAKSQTPKKLTQLTLDRITHAEKGDAGNSPMWPMATKSFYYQR